MLSKETKIRVLEDFYALDYIFFGKPSAKLESCCPLVLEEYISVKGALVSTFIEMLKLVDHKPKPIKEVVNSKELYTRARKSAKIARENAKAIVSSSKARQNIKTELREALREDASIDVTKLVEQKIREKAFRLAVDNLMIAKTITESKNYKSLDKWEGRIVEDAYKILRDSLVESAISLLDNDDTN